MKDVTPADMFKLINELKKQIKDNYNRGEMSAISRDKIWSELRHLNSKSSRLEKLVVVLALIQTVTLILGVT